MNYDNHLLNKAYNHDERPDCERVYIVAVDEEIVYNNYDENFATQEYYRLRIDDYSALTELGWVWENDLDHMNLKETYRLMNPILTSKKN